MCVDQKDIERRILFVSCFSSRNQASQVLTKTCLSGNTTLVVRSQVGTRRIRHPAVFCSLSERTGSDSRNGDGAVPRHEDAKSWRRRIDSDIGSIALPAFATMTIDPIMSVVDSAFVGRLGSAQLGGVGVASTVFRVLFSLFTFLNTSLTPIVARQPNASERSKSIAASLQVAFVAGSLVTFFLHSFAPQLIAALAGRQSDPELLIHAISYIRWRSFAGPILLMSFVSTSAFRGIQDTKTPLRTALIANFTNLFLDFVFVVLFKTGVPGAAAATAASQIVSAVLLVFFLWKRKLLQVPHLFHRPSKANVSGILNGALLSIRSISILSTFTYASGLASRLGTSAMAAHEVVRQVWLLFAVSLDSIAVAATSILSREVAADSPNMKEARKISKRLVQLGVGFGSCLGILTIAFRNYLPLIFTTQSSVVSAAASVFVLVGLFQPICSSVFVFDGIFAAFPSQYGYISGSILFAGVFAILSLFALSNFLPGLGLCGVWLGLNVLMLGRSVALGMRLLSRASPLVASESDSGHENQGPSDAELVRAST